jgi:hypothetical protein
MVQKVRKQALFDLLVFEKVSKSWKFDQKSRKSKCINKCWIINIRIPNIPRPKMPIGAKRVDAQVPAF